MAPPKYKKGNITRKKKADEEKKVWKNLAS